MCMLLCNPIIVDFYPVTDFHEATCRQYEEDICNRGSYCNFMHLKKISRELRKQLFGRSGMRRQSRSPQGWDNREECSRGGGRGYGGGSGDDKDLHHQDRVLRPRSRSPGRRGRNRSPREQRNRSLVREGSAERRA